MPLSPGHLRSWGFVIPVSFLTTGVMITIAMVGALFTKSQEWQVKMYRRWAAMILWITGANVRVVGAERLPRGANYVVASNHLSLIDTPVLLGSMPVDFKFLAKEELLRVPFIGWYLKQGGHLTVSRGSIRSSMTSMNEAARLIREKLLSVLIFPEGTRSNEGLQQFKDGAAYLAIQSQTPLLPVGIVGTDKVLPARSSCFHDGEVELRIGEPLPVQGLTLKERGALTAELQKRVSDLIR